MFPGAFPPIFSIQTAQAKTDHTNQVYKGWNVKVDHLFFANGIRESAIKRYFYPRTHKSHLPGDPWKESTVSARNHTVPSTDMQPVALSDGFHCSDLGTSAAKVDPTIAAVHAKALASMKSWLATWKPSNSYHHGYRRSANVVGSTADSQSKPINAFSKGAGVL